MEARIGHMAARIGTVALAIAAAVVFAGWSWSADAHAALPTAGGTSSSARAVTSLNDTATRCAAVRGGREGVFTNLVDVRVGRHVRYDRIVFEFAAPSPNPGGNAGIPAYVIRTARPPLLRDPSGLPMRLAGRAFASVVFHGASGYDLDGQPTYDGPRRLRPRYDVLVAAAQAGDFEATLSWYLGLRHRVCWRVHELRNPDRVAIDFPHG